MKISAKENTDSIHVPVSKMIQEKTLITYLCKEAHRFFFLIWHTFVEYEPTRNSYLYICIQVYTVTVMQEFEKGCRMQWKEENFLKPTSMSTAVFCDDAEWIVRRKVQMLRNTPMAVLKVICMKTNLFPLQIIVFTWTFHQCLESLNS